MKKNIKVILKIILANIYPSLLINRGTKGTISARYCYSVWMRHLIYARENGLCGIPDKVAEFGPGDSIGIGLCALLCGSNEYYSLDFVKHANAERNLNIFNELVEMFKSKTAIPDNFEFPEIVPELDDYSFPDDILTDEIIASALDESRIERIRNAISSPHPVESNKEKIIYIAPWNADDLKIYNIGFVYSQAVLEHIDELDAAYASMHKILAEGGYMSHVIDFKSHNTAVNWNGHWGYTEFLWKVCRGRLPYLINRCPFSAHIKICEKHKFHFIKIKKSEIPLTEGIKRKRLKYPFVEMSDDDFTTIDAYILCRKVD